MPNNLDPEVRKENKGPKDDEWVQTDVQQEMTQSEEVEEREDGTTRRHRTRKRVRHKQFKSDTGDVKHHCVIL